MEILGVPKEYVDPLKASTVSHVAIGYAGYKVSVEPDSLLL